MPARWWYWHGPAVGWQTTPPPPLHFHAGAAQQVARRAQQPQQQMVAMQQEEQPAQRASLFRMVFPYLVVLVVLSEVLEYFVTELTIGAETATSPPVTKIAVQEGAKKK